MAGQFAHITYEVAEGRARITLNRPEVRNALSRRMQQELHDALWEADDDTRVHCVVLRGAGPDFCAGYDLTEAPPRSDDVVPRRGAASVDDDAWQLERAGRLRMAIFEMHKPVIAAVHGHCLAGGTDLALLCDLVVAADDARIGFPPARNLGSLPNHMWVYLVGPQWAKRLLLTGDLVTGADAARIGLVLKAVPADLLNDEVEGLADRMARIDPDLLSANKRVVNLALELMGAGTLQRLAAEIDARAHRATAARAFAGAVAEVGLREAIRRRDAPFGDGLAHPGAPEGRPEPS